MTSEVREFYNQYGLREWERLDADVYRRIIFIQHMDFIKEYIKPGVRVLDAGCGAGRYSIEFAKMGCDVTLFDISDEQLKIAEEKITESGVNAQISGYIQGDIRDLSMFPAGMFDVVICYGAPLSYVLDGRERAVSELYRVLKSGGVVAASVNNKWGVLRDLIGRQYPDFFNNPEYWYVDKVLETGDLPRHEKIAQPPRHFFHAGELKCLFEAGGFTNLSLGASPCIITGSRMQANELCEDEAAYATILDTEMRAYKNEAMADAGEFLLIKGTKENCQ